MNGRYEVRLWQGSELQSCITVVSSDSIRVAVNRYNIWAGHVESERGTGIEVVLWDTDHSETLETMVVAA